VSVTVAETAAASVGVAAIVTVAAAAPGIVTATAIASAAGAVVVGRTRTTAATLREPSPHRRARTPRRSPLPP
jgi:hypothetical protein